MEESWEHVAGKETGKATKSWTSLVLNTKGDKTTRLQHQMLPAKDFFSSFGSI